MATRYNRRTPSSAAEAACIFAADFAAVCKANREMRNYYRWRMVLADLRRAALIPALRAAFATQRAEENVARKQQQHSLPLM